MTDELPTLVIPTLTPLPTDTPVPAATETAVISPTPAPLFQTSGLVKAHFFEDGSGWGVDVLGNIERFAGGSRWQNVAPPGAKRGVGGSRVLVHFLDDAHAWAIYMPQNSGRMEEIVIWGTADGGQTWEQSEPITSEYEQMIPTDLFFVDAQNGWFLGQVYPGMHHVYGFLYGTHDGGKTWDLLSDPVEEENPAAFPASYSLPYGPELMTFLDPATGFTGGPELYRTMDGGENWTAVALPDPPDLPKLDNPYHYVSAPDFVSASDGILVYSAHRYDDIFCPPCDLTPQIPAALYLYVTHDGGETWTPVQAPAALGRAGMVDETTAWFIGRNNSGELNGSIFLSTDGGLTWDEQGGDTAVPACAELTFASDDQIYAFSPYQDLGQYLVQAETFNACQNTFMFKSEDGGESWARTEW